MGRYRRNSRFRRKSGVWFPTTGTNWPASEGNDVYYDASISATSAQVEDERAAGVNSEVFALVPDFTFLPSEGTANRAASLHDRVSGNEWKLDRILGRCLVNCVPGDVEVADEWPYVQVACGIFVARSEEGADGVPDLFSDEYDPLNRDNIQNSWVWRKSWILGNPGGEGVLRDDFPISNVKYTTPITSPELDVKSKRRIRREHRLFFTYSVMGWQGNRPDHGSATNTQPYINLNLDYRIYGKLITNPRGSSSF